MPADALSTLQFPSWRGISFPLTSLENGFTQEHVEHKFIYREGMHIETTGRNGLNFLGRIPFNNGVNPGDFEPWAGQVLFPTLFKKFLNACLDGSAGEFLHPDFGPLTCKARDIQWRYVSNLRDGAEITVRWYETIDDPDNAETLTAGKDPNAAAVRTASLLDGQLESVGPLPELSNDKSSFTDLVSDYQSGDGTIGAISSKLENTSSALDRLDDVAYWPLRQATDDMRSALIDLGNGPGASNGTLASRQTRSYTVPVGTSLASIGVRLGVRTDSLVRMNPSLARDPYVRAGTRLRYQPS